jgi:hypothetical protein
MKKQILKNWWIIFILFVMGIKYGTAQEVKLGYLHGFGTDYTNASYGAFIELDNIGFQVDTGAYVTQGAYEILYTPDLETYDDWSPGGTFTRVGAFTKIPLNYSPLELKLGMGAMMSEGITMTGIKEYSSIYFQVGANIKAFNGSVVTVNYVNSSKGNANTILVGLGIRIF